MADVALDMAAAGLANAFSSAVLNPSDVTKIRLQNQGSPPLYSGLADCVRQIVRHEGAAALWTTGLAASMLRESLYSTTRMGLYPHVKRTLGTSDDALGGKILAGAVTGSLGSLLSNPVDVVKIRLMAEAGALGEGGKYTSGLRAGQAPSYSDTLQAMRCVAYEDGGRGLFRGAVPSVTRGALMAASQLASYDHSKHVGKHHFGCAEGLPLHVACSLISGVCAVRRSTRSTQICRQHSQERTPCRARPSRVLCNPAHVGPGLRHGARRPSQDSDDGRRPRLPRPAPLRRAHGAPRGRARALEGHVCVLPAARPTLSDDLPALRADTNLVWPRLPVRK